MGDSVDFADGFRYVVVVLVVRVLGYFVSVFMLFIRDWIDIGEFSHSLCNNDLPS